MTALRIAMVYARVPKMHCAGKCQSCCGPIAMSDAELVKLGGPIDFDPDTLTCRKLAGGRCSIYKDRPLICRLWGTVPEIACPHGCEPERWLTAGEARKLLAEMEAIEC